MIGQLVRSRVVGCPAAFVRRRLSGGRQRCRLPGVQSFREGGKIAEDQ